MGPSLELGERMHWSRGEIVMSIADHFAKTPEEELPRGFDARAARRQFGQSLAIIALSLACAAAIFTFRTPADRDIRPAGPYAVSAAQAEREAGHAMRGFGALPVRVAPDPPTAKPGYDRTLFALSDRPRRPAR